LATTSYIRLAEELRKLRGSAHRKFGKELPVVYEIEIKESGAPDLRLVDSITAVIHHLRTKEVPEQTLEAKIQVFTELMDNGTELYRYVGKTEFFGGKRRLMYKREGEELNVGASIKA